MKKNKYLGIGMSLGLMIGACIGSLTDIIMSNSNFLLSLPIGAGFGMLIGIVVGSILDSQSKK